MCRELECWPCWRLWCLLQVLACSWDDLCKKVHKAQDLDCVISAHQQFLEAIVHQSLLSQDAKVSILLTYSVYNMHYWKSYLININISVAVGILLLYQHQFSVISLLNIIANTILFFNVQYRCKHTILEFAKCYCSVTHVHIQNDANFWIYLHCKRWMCCDAFFPKSRS